MATDGDVHVAIDIMFGSLEYRGLVGEGGYDCRII
jgi:hypothetical protein